MANLKSASATARNGASTSMSTLGLEELQNQKLILTCTPERSVSRRTCCF
jgi:hypothetical protein